LRGTRASLPWRPDGRQDTAGAPEVRGYRLEVGREGEEAWGTRVGPQSSTRCRRTTKRWPQPGHERIWPWSLAGALMRASQPLQRKVIECMGRLPVWDGARVEPARREGPAPVADTRTILAQGA